MKEIKEIKMILLDKKSAFVDGNGEIDIKGAPYGVKTKIMCADVVAVLGRGSKIQVLKSRTGYSGVRVSPVKFLRMLIDETL